MSADPRPASAKMIRIASRRNRGASASLLARAAHGGDHFQVRVILGAMICLSLTGCAASPQRAPSDWPPRASDAFASPSSVAAVGFAQGQVGKRYCWGGAGPGCYDCSGLVQAAWGFGGVRLPHGSEALTHALAEIAPEEIRAGDILWWPGHVALYVGGGAMVEAQGARAGVVRRRVAFPERVLRVR